MTRNEFFAALGAKLAGLPAEEQKKVVDYYNEYFNEAADAGKSEEEIMAKLDTPDAIAARVKAEAVFLQAERKPSMANWLKVLLSVLGLMALPIALPVAIAVISVIFAIFIAVMSVVLALAAAAIGLLISGVSVFAAGLGMMFSGNVATGMIMVGVGLLLTGLSIIFGLGIAAAGRGLVLATTAISKWIYSKVNVKRGEK